MTSIRIKIVSVALVLLAAGLSSCGSPSPDPPASSDPASNRVPVVLVTIDTLRADRLSEGGPMPRLWELAARGYRFTTVHVPAPLTLPSHVTILTSLGLQHHGVRDNIGYALPGDVPTVAEEFSASGWATAAFVGGYPLDHAFGLARGFDLYDDTMTRTPADGLSLMPELRSHTGESVPKSRPFYLESIHGRQRYGWSPLAGFVEWPEKYLSAPRPELFDLGRDPREADNLFDRANAEELESRLDEIRAPDEEFAAAADPGIDVDLERLTSLGYVGGSGVAQTEEAFRQALAVRPGFTMALFNLAFVMHQQGSSREALREPERVQSEEPGFPGLPGFMGEVRRAVGLSR